MDSPNGFEDEEAFFASYDAEQANAAAQLELDAEAAQPPTREELAHLARFRRPVAIVVSSMALLSILALGMHGSLQRSSQREFVAHYSSAIAAPPPAAVATGAVQPKAIASEASSGFVPEAFSAFLAEALSALLPEAFSATNAAAPALTVNSTAPALEPGAPLTEISAQPGSSPVSAFISVSTQMCLRPLGSNYGPRQ